MQIGRHCFDEVVQLNHNDASSYVLMSNMYSEALVWDKADKIQEMKSCASAWKKPGMSWIEVENKMHQFVVGGIFHDLSDEIHAKLSRLRRPLKKESYLPHLDGVFAAMSDEDKEDASSMHFDKSAMALELVTVLYGESMKAV